MRCCLCLSVLFLVTAGARCEEPDKVSRTIALLEKFDKRMDKIDHRLDDIERWQKEMDGKLKELEKKYGTSPPMPFTPPSPIADTGKGKASDFSLRLYQPTGSQSGWNTRPVREGCCRNPCPCCGRIDCPGPMPPGLVIVIEVSFPNNR